jgi:hypothetical protein
MAKHFRTICKTSVVIRKIEELTSQCITKIAAKIFGQTRFLRDIADRDQLLEPLAELASVEGIAVKTFFGLLSVAGDSASSIATAGTRQQEESQVFAMTATAGISSLVASANPEACSPPDAATDVTASSIYENGSAYIRSEFFPPCTVNYSPSSASTIACPITWERPELAIATASISLVTSCLTACVTLAAHSSVMRAAACLHATMTAIDASTYPGKCPEAVFVARIAIGGVSHDDNIRLSDAQTYIKPDATYRLTKNWYLGAPSVGRTPINVARVSGLTVHDMNDMIVRLIRTHIDGAPAVRVTLEYDADADPASAIQVSSDQLFGLITGRRYVSGALGATVGRDIMTIADLVRYSTGTGLPDKIEQEHVSYLLNQPMAAAEAPGFAWVERMAPNLCSQSQLTPGPNPTSTYGVPISDSLARDLLGPLPNSRTAQPGAYVTGIDWGRSKNELCMRLIDSAAGEVTDGSYTENDNRTLVHLLTRPIYSTPGPMVTAIDQITDPSVIELTVASASHTAAVAFNSLLDHILRSCPATSILDTDAADVESALPFIGHSPTLTQFMMRPAFLACVGSIIPTVCSDDVCHFVSRHLSNAVAAARMIQIGQHIQQVFNDRPPPAQTTGFANAVAVRAWAKNMQVQVANYHAAVTAVSDSSATHVVPPLLLTDFAYQCSAIFASDHLVRAGGDAVMDNSHTDLSAGSHDPAKTWQKPKNNNRRPCPTALTRHPVIVDFETNIRACPASKVTLEFTKKDGSMMRSAKTVTDIAPSTLMKDLLDHMALSAVVAARASLMTCRQQNVSCTGLHSAILLSGLVNANEIKAASTNTFFLRMRVDGSSFAFRPEPLHTFPVHCTSTDLRIATDAGVRDVQEPFMRVIGDLRTSDRNVLVWMSMAASALRKLANQEAGTHSGCKVAAAGAFIPTSLDALSLRDHYASMLYQLGLPDDDHDLLPDALRPSTVLNAFSNVPILNPLLSKEGILSCFALAQSTPAVKGLRAWIEMSIRGVLAPRAAIFPRSSAIWSAYDPLAATFAALTERNNLMREAALPLSASGVEEHGPAYWSRALNYGRILGNHPYISENLGTEILRHAETRLNSVAERIQATDTTVKQYLVVHPPPVGPSTSIADGLATFYGSFETDQSVTRYKSMMFTSNQAIRIAVLEVAMTGPRASIDGWASLLRPVVQSYRSWGLYNDMMSSGRNPQSLRDDTWFSADYLAGMESVASDRYVYHCTMVGPSPETAVDNNLVHVWPRACVVARATLLAERDSVLLGSFYAIAERFCPPHLAQSFGLMMPEAHKTLDAVTTFEEASRYIVKARIRSLLEAATATTSTGSRACASNQVAAEAWLLYVRELAFIMSGLSTAPLTPTTVSGVLHSQVDRENALFKLKVKADLLNAAHIMSAFRYGGIANFGTITMAAFHHLLAGPISKFSPAPLPFGFLNLIHGIASKQVKHLTGHCVSSIAGAWHVECGYDAAVTSPYDPETNLAAASGDLMAGLMSKQSVEAYESIRLMCGRVKRATATTLWSLLCEFADHKVQKTVTAQRVDRGSDTYLTDDDPTDPTGGVLAAMKGSLTDWRYTDAATLDKLVSDNGLREIRNGRATTTVRALSRVGRLDGADLTDTILSPDYIRTMFFRRVGPTYADYSIGAFISQILVDYPHTTYKTVYQAVNLVGKKTAFTAVNLSGVPFNAYQLNHLLTLVGANIACKPQALHSIILDWLRIASFALDRQPSYGEMMSSEQVQELDKRLNSYVADPLNGQVVGDAIDKLSVSAPFLVSGESQAGAQPGRARSATKPHRISSVGLITQLRSTASLAAQSHRKHLNTLLSSVSAMTRILNGLRYANGYVPAAGRSTIMSIYPFEIDVILSHMTGLTSGEAAFTATFLANASHTRNRLSVWRLRELAVKWADIFGSRKWDTDATFHQVIVLFVIAIFACRRAEEHGLSTSDRNLADRLLPIAGAINRDEWRYFVARERAAVSREFSGLVLSITNYTLSTAVDVGAYEISHSTWALSAGPCQLSAILKLTNCATQTIDDDHQFIEVPHHPIVAQSIVALARNRISNRATALVAATRSRDTFMEHRYSNLMSELVAEFIAQRPIATIGEERRYVFRGYCMHLITEAEENRTRMYVYPSEDTMNAIMCYLMSTEIIVDLALCTGFMPTMQCNTLSTWICHKLECTEDRYNNIVGERPFLCVPALLCCALTPPESRLLTNGPEEIADLLGQVSRADYSIFSRANDLDYIDRAAFSLDKLISHPKAGHDDAFRFADNLHTWMSSNSECQLVQLVNVRPIRNYGALTRLTYLFAAWQVLFFACGMTSSLPVCVTDLTAVLVNVLATRDVTDVQGNNHRIEVSHREREALWFATRYIVQQLDPQLKPRDAKTAFGYVTHGAALLNSDNKYSPWPEMTTSISATLAHLCLTAEDFDPEVARMIASNSWASLMNNSNGPIARLVNRAERLSADFDENKFGNFLTSITNRVRAKAQTLAGAALIMPDVRPRQGRADFVATRKRRIEISNLIQLKPLRTEDIAPPTGDLIRNRQSMSFQMADTTAAEPVELGHSGAISIPFTIGAPLPGPVSAALRGVDAMSDLIGFATCALYRLAYDFGVIE